MQDPAECFSLVHNLVADTPAEPLLLSVLQHLLLIRDDHTARFAPPPPTPPHPSRLLLIPPPSLSDHRPYYYQLIEECVSQIVLHRGGIDPDPRTRFALDVDHLVEGMASIDTVSPRPALRLAALS